MLTDIDLSGLKRETGFPFPLLRAGYFEHYQPKYETHCFHDRVEVCLRCHSEEPFAVDRLDGKEFHTPFPHCMLKEAEMVHHFGAAAPREGIFLIYSLDTARELRKTRLFPDGPIQRFFYRGELFSLAEEFRNILAEVQTFFAADRLDLLGIRILEELRRSSFAEQENSPENRIRAAASRVRMYPTETFSAAELARRFGFSDRNFFRLWKKFQPGTPAAFITEVRLNQAAHLLIRTEMRISEIAQLLHFCDDNYFSAAFRKQFGVSPREYRHSLRANHIE